MKRWIHAYKAKRMGFMKKKGKEKKKTTAPQALVLFGNSEIDVRQMVGLVCKEMEVKATYLPTSFFRWSSSTPA